jgi:hypothetical protein
MQDENVEMEVEIVCQKNTEAGIEIEVTLTENKSNLLDSTYLEVLNHILCYLAGYIVHCLVPVIKCPQCKFSLISNPEDS